MSSSLLTGVIAIAVVVALALFMRRSSSDEDTSVRPTTPGSAPDDALDEPDEDLDEDGEPEVIAVTSEGLAFMPHGDEVHLVPPRRPAEPWEGSPGAMEYGRSGRDPDARMGLVGEMLRKGELIGARVKRGSPDFDPWRLEALGRDGDYRYWSFETEEAAKAARAIVEERIVRTPTGEDGDEQTIGDADFARAREMYEATESDLATMPEEEEEDEPR